MAMYHIPDLRVSSKLPDDLPASAQVQRPRSLAPSSGLGCPLVYKPPQERNVTRGRSFQRDRMFKGKTHRRPHKTSAAGPPWSAKGLVPACSHPLPPPLTPGLGSGPRAPALLCGWGPQPPGCWYPQPLYLLLATAVPSWDTLLFLETMSPAWWGHFWDPLGHLLPCLDPQGS